LHSDIILVFCESLFSGPSCLREYTGRCSYTYHTSSWDWGGAQESEKDWYITILGGEVELPSIYPLVLLYDPCVGIIQSHPAITNAKYQAIFVQYSGCSV